MHRFYWKNSEQNSFYKKDLLTYINKTSKFCQWGSFTYTGYNKNIESLKYLKKHISDQKVNIIHVQCF